MRDKGLVKRASRFSTHHIGGFVNLSPMRRGTTFDGNLAEMPSQVAGEIESRRGPRSGEVLSALARTSSTCRAPIHTACNLEELISAVSRERDGHVLSRQLRYEIGRNLEESANGSQ